MALRELKSRAKSEKKAFFVHFIAFPLPTKFHKILSPFAAQFLDDADWTLYLNKQCDARAYGWRDRRSLS
jgi:hypothetical protein